MKLFGQVIITISAFIMFGIVGSIELERMTLSEGVTWIFWCFICMGIGWVFTELSTITRKDIVRVLRRLSK